MPVRRAQRSPRARSRAVPAARLHAYHVKRDLAASGEPGGARSAVVRKSVAAATRRFVIQKHDATRLHYDFRLEMAGVLRSWAVPKGIPTKAGDQVLAVEVEDHPLDYGGFEGVIPEGNYGGGTVMLWDRGDYLVTGGSPEESYRRGKIHVAIAGSKCVGEWTLVRMRPRPGEKHINWLLIKNSGRVHRAPMTGAARDTSVLTGRTLAEIANRRKTKTRTPLKRKARGASATTVARRQRSRGGKEPAAFVAPMKALSVDVVPTGKWRLEVKLDGYRAIAVRNGDVVELWSRNQKPLTDDYPEVVAAVKKLRCRNAVIDGEIVALDARGRSRFQLLQGRSQRGARPPIVYYVFDLLHHDGRSLVDEPIEERQAALERLVGQRTGAIRFSPVFETDPAELLEAVRQQGLEGIIAKKAGSRYEIDRRSGTWLKCKVHGEQEFVIGGFTPPRNSRPYFGAILVGHYEGRTLHYAGKVGSGYDHAALKSLHAEFMKRRVDACPFVDLPRPKKPRFGAGMTAGEMRHVTWLKPELVCQVRFTEWTDDGALRHPVFLGLRHDKSASDVVRETAPVPKASG